VSFVRLSAPSYAMLSYERLGGAGIPILFLHGGWGYSLYPIEHQAAALAPHCQFFIPSRSGYGKSTRVSHFDLNFHQMAALEMLAFLDACKIHRCVAWGHSDGAVIAAWMGLVAPERFYGLILEAFHFSPKKPASADFFLQGATRPDELKENVRLILEAEHGNDWREVVRRNCEVWLRLGREQREDDLFGGRLSGLKPSTLVLHSQDDPRSEAQEIETAVKQLPHAAFQLFETGAHSPHSHQQTKEKCTRLIQRFVSEIALT